MSKMSNSAKKDSYLRDIKILGSSEISSYIGIQVKKGKENLYPNVPIKAHFSLFSSKIL